MALIEELADEFLFNIEEINPVLNLETGEILIDESEIDWESEAAENLVMIPQITSSEAYDIRLDFVEEQKSKAGEILLEALNQRKPFRNFKIQLAHLQLEDEWYSFEYQYAKKRMAEWLDEWKND